MIVEQKDSAGRVPQIGDSCFHFTFFDAETLKNRSNFPYNYNDGPPRIDIEPGQATILRCFQTAMLIGPDEGETSVRYEPWVYNHVGFSNIFIKDRSQDVETRLPFYRSTPSPMIYPVKNGRVLFYEIDGVGLMVSFLPG